jgi:hypothetical protein
VGGAQPTHRPLKFLGSNFVLKVTHSCKYMGKTRKNGEQLPEETLQGAAGASMGIGVAKRKIGSQFFMGLLI